MVRNSLAAAAGGVGILLLALELAGCASAAPPNPAPTGAASPTLTPAAPAAPRPASAVHTAFVGYRWTVTAISDGGPEIAIPARYAVYLEFFKDRQFVANEPVNTHSGVYRVTADGFTTVDVASTDVLGGADDLASQVAIRAMEAFSGLHRTRAAAEVTGNWMTVTENGFTLVCTRAAMAGNPAPRPT